MKITSFWWTYTKIHINAFIILFLTTKPFHYSALIRSSNSHLWEVLVENAYMFFSLNSIRVNIGINLFNWMKTLKIVSPLWLNVKFKEAKMKWFLDINSSTEDFFVLKKTYSWSLNMWEYVYIPSNFLEKCNSIKIFSKVSIQLENNFYFSV